MDKARIFISYAREDESAVKQLYRMLSDAGFVPWMDKVDLLPGEQWRPAIEKALRKADFLIICLSNTSVQKRGFVRREFRAALDLWQEKHDDDIYIIPVRLEHCDPPDDLDRFQWLDLFEDSEWPKLIRALQEGMRRRGKALQVQRIIEPAPRQKTLEQALPAPTANTPLVAHKSLDAPSSPANQSQPESTTAPSDDPSKVVDLTEAGGGQQSKESLSADAHTEQKEQIGGAITQSSAPPNEVATIPIVEQPPEAAAEPVVTPSFAREWRFPDLSSWLFFLIAGLPVVIKPFELFINDKLGIIFGFASVNAALTGMVTLMRMVGTRGPTTALSTAVAGIFIDFGFTLLMVGLFVTFGIKARNFSGWAIIVGMRVYAIDCLLLLYQYLAYLRDTPAGYLAVVIHAVVLFLLYKSVSANIALSDEEATLVKGYTCFR